MSSGARRAPCSTSAIAPSSPPCHGGQGPGCRRRRGLGVEADRFVVVGDRPLEVPLVMAGTASIEERVGVLSGLRRIASSKSAIAPSRPPCHLGQGLGCRRRPRTRGRGGSPRRSRRSPLRGRPCHGGQCPVVEALAYSGSRRIASSKSAIAPSRSPLSISGIARLWNAGATWGSRRIASS